MHESGMSQRIIDLSHTIVDGMRTYPGIPEPTISAFLTHENSRERYDGQCEFTFSQVYIVAGVGTYLDSPYHRYVELPDFASLPLEAVTDLPGCVINVEERGGRAIEPGDLGTGNWSGCAVLLQTGSDRYWELDRYWDESPFLTAASAQRLIEGGAILLGVDFLNVDDLSDLTRPVHSALLGAQIPIVENLCNLSSLPPRDFRFHAAPIAFERVASFPVRAYAVVRAHA